MKTLTLACLLLSVFTNAQDTINIKATQPQVIQALLEKGFTIDTKQDGKIITKAYERRTISRDNENQILIRLSFIWQSGICKLSGEYTRRFSYIHEGYRAWIPIINDKIHAYTWKIVTNFSKYITSVP